jgi:hypothetical protein
LGVALVAFAWASTFPSTTRAELNVDNRSDRQRAADTYDRGVSEFDRGEYAAAAWTFLDADSIAENDDALENAIEAARRAKSKPLLEQAAVRVHAREHPAPSLENRLRDALNEVAAPTKEPAPLAAATPAPPPESRPLPTAAPAGPPPPAKPQVKRASAPSHASDAPDQPGRTWSPAVFYAGAGLSAVLLGITVWSGVDTLHARSEQPYTADERSSVYARAHRTDALLAATVVLSGATAYVGLRLVDWGDHTQVAASLQPGGASMAVSGSF